jgi:hypothetical protein
MDEADSGDRVFMIMGVDDQGDTHLVGTSDPDRAHAHYKRMATTMRSVRGNGAFNEIGRPDAGSEN